MAKYLKKEGKKVSYYGDDVKIDSKNRLYVMFSEDTTIPDVGVISKGQKTYVDNVNSVISIKGKK